MSHATMKKTIWLCLGVGMTIPSHAYQTTVFSPSSSDFGGVGLLQMPTGRMAAEGVLRTTVSRVSPYTRYALTMQPFSGLEATIQYTSIGNRRYGVTRDQSYKDKSIDLKFRILEESRYKPEVSIGMRDLAGTGIFSSEYIAGTKRFGNLDVTLGLGWGQLGQRGTSKVLGERNDTAVDFSSVNYFKGPMAWFGGIEYQSPHAPLRFKLEYDSNDYQHEFRGADQLEVDSPWNVGLNYQVFKNVDLMLGYERGNTWMIGLSFSENLKKLRAQFKSDVVAPALRAPLENQQTVNWPSIVAQLRSLHIPVERIESGNREVTVFVRNTVFANSAELAGLASRVLSNALPASYAWFNIITLEKGLALNEISVRRDHFVGAVSHTIAPEVLYASTEQLQPYAKNDHVVFQAKQRRFSYNLVPDLQVNIGGPDAFLLYQAQLHFDAQAQLSQGWSLSTRLSAALKDNYDIFNYNGSPETTGKTLPQVRTLIKDYVKGSKAWVDHLQLSYHKRLAENWYAMAYGGLLESMYGGIGLEFLYRGYQSNWALGLDINYVKQRDFKRHFGFRDYKTVTGHGTLYYKWQQSGILAKASVGRYLAKDIGATLDLSKQFHNGVTVGVYATKTDVSSAEFGEGSFDKGIYLSVPFNLLSSTHKRDNITMNWHPLIRDGGAKLSRQETLYETTEGLRRSGYDETGLLGPVAPLR